MSNEQKGLPESVYNECLDALEMLLEVFASGQIVTRSDDEQEVENDE